MLRPYDPKYLCRMLRPYGVSMDDQKSYNRLNGRKRCPNESIKFGLVGAGGIAHAYVQAFAQTEFSRTSGDRRPVRLEAATAMAEAAQCQAFQTHQEMIEAVER